MKCPPCQLGLCSSCQRISCDCNTAIHLQQESAPSLTSSEPKEIEEDEELRGSLGEKRRTGSRTQKRDAYLKDQQSTGRKRAARLYPLDKDKDCEWKGLSECGGGTRPIVGCVSGKQQSRHHGPDKSTSNNSEGNVHRICHRCHNRWHAANNKEYDWTSTTVKGHLPRPQTPQEKQEAILDELAFLANKEKKVRD